MLSEKDTKGKISVEELESLMKQTLKQLGINTEDDLILSDLASNFKKYFLKDRDVLKSKVYSRRVNNEQTAGQVILALEKIEISNVVLDKTEFSGNEQLKLELKSQAIAQAKKQVEHMVYPLNQKVGTAVHISDQSDASEPNVLQGRATEIILRGYSSLKPEELKPANIESEKIR